MNDKLTNYEKTRKENRKGYLIIASLSAITFFIFGIIASSYFDLTDYSPLNEEDKNLAKFKEFYKLMKDEWVFGNEAEELLDNYKLEDYFIDNAINGLISNSLDPHTRYQKAIGSDSSLTCGLGILMERLYMYPLVSTVYPDSGAFEGGMKELDLILEINGTNIRGVTNDEIQELVKGDCGTNLNVKVNRDGEDINLEIQRKRLNRISAYKGEANDKFIEIRLIDFSETADDDFERILKNEEQLPPNLVLDLRNNGGGRLDTTVHIASSLLGKNKKVVTLKSNKKVEDEYTSGSTHYNFEHIFILINENSASASEVLTLALKEHLQDKVTIIGTTSFGKGTAQNTYTFKQDGSSLVYTFAKWYLPINDVNIHGVGINPDIELTSLYTNEYKDLEYDVLNEHKLYDMNETIKSVKKILNNQGYEIIEHAFFDENFKQALIEYQTLKGITPSGKIDQGTNDYLISLVRNTRKAEMDLTINKVVELIGD